MQTYCWPGYQTQLLRALQQQQNDAQHCDTLLQTEDISIPAHRCVLAALSPHLSKRLSAVPTPPPGQKWQLRLPAVTSHTLLKLVGLLYSGAMEVKSRSEQRDVLAAAHRLGIPDLMGRTDWRLEEGRGPRAKLQDVGVQAGVSGHNQKRFVSTSTQTSGDEGGGNESVDHLLPSMASSHSPQHSSSVPMPPIDAPDIPSARPDGGSEESPSSPAIQTSRRHDGDDAAGGADGGREEVSAGRPPRQAGVKSVARMRQMMEEAQFSIKVKLRRRTKGESWEVVNETQRQLERSVSDSSPLSAASFNTDQSREVEPPPAILEETDEQIDRLLEDIMLGLNILPSLEKEGRKAQTADAGIHCYLLPQSPSGCSSVLRSQPEASVQHGPPSFSPKAPPQQTVPPVTRGGPQSLGDDSVLLCTEDFWLPQCLSPLGSSSSACDAQISETSTDVQLTGIPNRPWLSETPASPEFAMKEKDKPSPQDPQNPGHEETGGQSDPGSPGTPKDSPGTQSDCPGTQSDCPGMPRGQENEGSNGLEKRTKGPKLLYRDSQIHKCSVNLSSDNLLVTHKDMCSVLLGMSPSVPSAQQPRVTTRYLARTTHQIELQTGVKSYTRRRGRPPKSLNKNEAKELKNVENKAINGRNNVDIVNTMKRNEQNNVKVVEVEEKSIKDQEKNDKNMKKIEENRVKIFENMKKNVEKKKQNQENNEQNLVKKEKDLENKEKNLENKEKNLENKEKNLENKEKNRESKEKNQESKKKNQESKEKNLENKKKNLESKEKNVENNKQNVREEVEGASTRRNKKRKRDAGGADQIPQKKKQEKEINADDHKVLEEVKLIQPQTAKGLRRKGSKTTRDKKTADVAMATEVGGQCVKSTEGGGGGGGEVGVSEEGGNEEVTRRLQAPVDDDDDEAGGEHGGERGWRQAKKPESCEEDVDVGLCSPLRDTPTCPRPAHSEDTCEDGEENDEVDVTGV